MSEKSRTFQAWSYCVWENQNLGMQKGLCETVCIGKWFTLNNYTSTVETRFKKARFKKESQFKRDFGHSQNLS